MDEDRLINSELDNEEVQYDNSLRPSQLAEYVGQEKIKENLNIFIAAAKMREESLDHVLFYGPPGLGKTTLANIIAGEMGANLKSTSGPVIEKTGDLAALLTNLKKGDVLFIDEIHRLSNVIEEILYSAMEDYKLDIMIGQGPSARSISWNCRPSPWWGPRQGQVFSPPLCATASGWCIGSTIITRRNWKLFSPVQPAYLKSISFPKEPMKLLAAHAAPQELPTDC